MKKPTYEELKESRNRFIGLFFIAMIGFLIIVYQILFNVSTHIPSYQAGYSQCMNESKEYKLTQLPEIENQLVISDRPCVSVPCPQEYNNVYLTNYCMVCKENSK